MYADYTYYTDEYKGTLLNEETFNEYSVRAKSFIDYITLKRAVKGYENPVISKDISMCTCALTDTLYTQNQHLTEQKELREKIANNEVVTSETIGKQSVSFQKLNEDKRTNVEINNDNKQELKDVCYQYLMFTGLLYRGI